MMKKMTALIILTVFLYQTLPAPGFMVSYLAKPESIKPYERIVNAITTVESSNGRNIFNEKENAVGWFGIRPIRLKDYCNRTSKHITLDQCYDYEVSKRIFLYYATVYNPDDYRLIARDWNKSKTEKYWHKVRAAL
jgi:hypothetical protein